MGRLSVIADSQGVLGPDKGHKSYRFFQYEGERAIPASSLRGMVRSVYEAATNSCFGVFDGDRRLSYHEEPKDAKNLVPAIVEEKSDGSFQLKLLTGTTGYKPDGITTNDMAYAAWVRVYELYGKKRVIESETVKQNPTTAYAKRELVNLSTDCVHGVKCFALLENMEHPCKRLKNGNFNDPFNFWNVKKLAIDGNKLPKLDESKKQRIVEGWLCITNQNMFNKHDERLFFVTNDNPDNGVVLDLTKKVVDEYDDLIKDYRGRHGKEVANRNNPDKFDQHNDKPAFSRFILSSEKLTPGSLVYTKLNNENGELSVKYIVPVSIPRVSYEKKIGDLLDSKYHTCVEYSSLCPSCRLFGWVRGLNTKVRDNGTENDEDKLSEYVSYKGRLIFDHAKLIKLGENDLPGQMPLAILSSPKPTTWRFYLLSKKNLSGRKWDQKGYKEDNKLRGRKFYRHHKVFNENNWKMKGDNSEQNRTVRDVVPKNSEFKFSIKFNNLAEIELGALIWALELGGKVHRLGYAKPLGFGSINIKVANINLVAPAIRYSSFKTDGIKPLIDEQKNSLVKLFTSTMCGMYGSKSFDELTNIKDLLALVSEPYNNLPVHYPRPKKEIDNKIFPSYKWFIANKNKCVDLSLAEDDKGLPFSEK